ncbi:MAG: hypothetical protein GY854_00200 [Deltaproteobacteria bacterium]|nr:hypothetical protein [Deltaproteobacteria bacterium]
MTTDDLDKMLTETYRAESTPDFEETWRSAELLAAKRKQERFSWRPILVSAAALGAIVAIVLAVFAFTPETENGIQSPSELTRGDVSRTLAELTDIEPWTASLDGLGTEWSYDEVFIVDIDDEENNKEDSDEVALTLLNNIPGESVYESPTDFLLNLEIPVWNRTEKRSVL